MTSITKQCYGLPMGIFHSSPLSCFKYAFTLQCTSSPSGSGSGAPDTEASSSTSPAPAGQAGCARSRHRRPLKGPGLLGSKILLCYRTYPPVPTQSQWRTALPSSNSTHHHSTSFALSREPLSSCALESANQASESFHAVPSFVSPDKRP